MFRSWLFDPLLKSGQQNPENIQPLGGMWGRCTPLRVVWTYAPQLPSNAAKSLKALR